MINLNDYTLFWEQIVISKLNINKIIIEPHQLWSIASLSHSMLLIHRHGQSTILLNDDSYYTEQCFLLHAGAGSSIQIRAVERPSEWYMIEYAPSTLEALPAALLNADSAIEPEQQSKLHASDMLTPYWYNYGLKLQYCIEMLALLESMTTYAMHTKTAIQQNIVLGLFYQFIEKLLQQLTRSFVDNQQEDFFSILLQYIKLHYKEDITLEQLAQLSNNSVRHVGRQFKERIGISPIEYVISLRMREASLLLQTSDTSLQEIAEFIGYSDSYTFSKMFKKHCGIAPIHYRNLYRKTTNILYARSWKESHHAIMQANYISTLRDITTIPLHPKPSKRVVVLYHIGDVLACGITPVGVSDLYPGACFSKELAGITQVGTWYKPDIEAIAQLKPDLIIVPSEKLLLELSSIAPTLCIESERYTAEERLALIANYLGNTSAYRSRLRQLEATAAWCKQQLKEAGVTSNSVTIIEGGLKRVSIISNRSSGRGALVVYQYLGLAAPTVLKGALAHADHNYYVQTTVTQLPKFAGDYMIRSSYSGMDDLSEEDAWNSLPAIANGRLVEIDFGLLYYSDILSMEQQMIAVTSGLLSCPYQASAKQA